MENLIIEKVKDCDINQINDISKEHWPEDGDYGYKTLKWVIDQGLSFCIKKENNVIAFCLITEQNRKLSIYLIAVKKGNEGRGLGKSITNHALTNARNKGYSYFKLNVSVTNAIAIKMYKKFKFKIKKYIPQYYNTSNKEENNAYKMILNDYGSRFNTI